MGGDYSTPAARAGKLAEGGLAGVTWPAEAGGQGLGPIEQVITQQEIGKAGVPGILDVIGVGMLGPTIIANGSDEQKSRYLAPMLHGDEVWCQLFSEPAAGSDLAAVQTRAARRTAAGANGQRCGHQAQFASFGCCSPAPIPSSTTQGLTCLVRWMPGVTVRGLPDLGEAAFNDVSSTTSAFPPTRFWARSTAAGSPRPREFSGHDRPGPEGLVYQDCRFAAGAGRDA